MAATTAQAATESWSAGSGDFFDHANWFTASPGPTDDAWFADLAIGPDYTVDITADAANNFLWISDQQPAFDITSTGVILGSPVTFGHTYTVNELQVSDQSGSDNPLMKVIGGTLFVNDNGYIGRFAGQKGRMTLTGAQTVLGVASPGFTTSRGMYIGDEGEGILTVEAGAQLQADNVSVGNQAGSTGTLNITTNASLSPPGAQYASGLEVGRFGAGTFNLNSGGSATPNNLYVGFGADAVGVVNIDGVGTSLSISPSLLISSATIIGYSGEGELNVTGGATASTYITYVAQQPGGTGSIEVDGAGSQLTTEALYLGNNASVTGGDGTATVSNGGKLLANDDAIIDGDFYINTGGLAQMQRIDVGQFAGSFGRIEVDGLNAELQAEDIFSGDGSSSIYVRNGGLINVNDTVGFFDFALVQGLGSRMESLYTVVSGDGAEMRINQGGKVSSFWGGFITPGDGNHAEATISGLNSQWYAPTFLDVGDDSTGTAVLNIEDNGSASAGALRLNPSGTINILGGQLVTNVFSPLGGEVNFHFGTVAFSSDHTLNEQEMDVILGASHQITPGRTLSVDGIATLNTPINLDGGTLRLRELHNPFFLNFNTGTLEFTDILALGGGGSPLGTAVSIGQDQTLIGGFEFNINSDATLSITGNGVARTDYGISNFGTILMDGPMAKLQATDIYNDGQIRGGGLVQGALYNQSGSVRVDGGDVLRFTGYLADNAGVIEVIGTPENPAEAAFDANVNNAGGFIDTGLIAVRNGTLRFNNGLTNQGALVSSAGVSDVFGDIDNTGSVAITGGAAVTFYGDVDQNGAFQVSSVGSTNSVAVFAGAFSGSGGITGGGDVFFEGDLRPGNSPDIVIYDADVAMGQTANTEIEIGGLTAGPGSPEIDDGYDRLIFEQTVDFGGTLDVVLINGFSPTQGNSFDIFLYEADVDGAFDTINLPTLDGGLAWDTDQLYSTGQISVVPEPATLGMLAIGSLLLTRRRR